MKRVIKFTDNREPLPGEAVIVSGNVMYFNGNKNFVTNTLPASAISYDHCEDAVIQSGITPPPVVIPQKDYCQDQCIDSDLDVIYINPFDNIQTGDKVFFNGRGYVKSGKTGRATHVLSAAPIPVTYSATCVVNRLWSDSGIWNDADKWRE